MSRNDNKNGVKEFYDECPKAVGGHSASDLGISTPGNTPGNLEKSLSTVIWCTRVFKPLRHRNKVVVF